MTVTYLIQCELDPHMTDLRNNYKDIVRRHRGYRHQLAPPPTAHCVHAEEPPTFLFLTYSIDLLTTAPTQLAAGDAEERHRDARTPFPRRNAQQRYFLSRRRQLERITAQRCDESRVTQVTSSDEWRNSSRRPQRQPRLKEVRVFTGVNTLSCTFHVNCL